MTVTGPILCMACTRLHHDTPEIATCTAYPQGIPADILDGADHHRKRGDEVDGMVFDAADTPGAIVALDAWNTIVGASAR